MSPNRKSATVPVLPVREAPTEQDPFPVAAVVAAVDDGDCGVDDDDPAGVVAAAAAAGVVAVVGVAEGPASL